jgi:dienelactone hydrolase
MQVFPEGCVVLIADILSDDSGWAWNPDRSKYDAARQHVLEADGQGTRRRLRNRIEAALAELSSFPNVDSSRLGAMGWCLGGQSILEMARMKSSGVKAMVTFHGVFDGAPPPTNVDREEEGQGCQILVCNGEQDPFVSKESLDNAIQTMEQFGHKVTLLQLEGAKHGFSSPAQDFNPNIAFGYNEQAAVKSWSATLDLLKSSF